MGLLHPPDAGCAWQARGFPAAACGAPPCCRVNDSSRVDTRGPPAPLAQPQEARVLPWTATLCSGPRSPRPAQWAPHWEPRCPPCWRVCCSQGVTGSLLRVFLGTALREPQDQAQAQTASTYPCQALGHVDQLHPLTIPGTRCCCLTGWEELGSEYRGPPSPGRPHRRPALC